MVGFLLLQLLLISSAQEAQDLAYKASINYLPHPVLRVTHQGKLIEKDLTGLNPWKVLVADIDHSGGPEIILGVEKKAYFEPVQKRRIRVYTLDEEGIHPLYFATFSPTAILDFSFYQDRLYILGPDHFLSEMAWDGFGFIGETRKFEIAPHISDGAHEHALKLCHGRECFTLAKFDGRWIASSTDYPGGKP